MDAAALAGVPLAQLWRPAVFLAAVAAEGLYLLLVVGPWNEAFPEARPVPAPRLLAFTLGVGAFYLACGSPLAYVADHDLFTAHIVQHMLLTAVMAPLLLLGTPDWLLRPLYRHPGGRRTLRFLARADVAFFSFNGLSALLLLPAVYDRLLGSGPWEGAANLALSVTAVVFWLPVLNPLPEMPPLTPGKRLLYLFFSADAVTSMVGFLFVDPPLYRPYFAHTAAFGLTPLGDQQLGATALLGIMILAYGTAFFATFLRYQGGMAGWYE